MMSDDYSAEIADLAVKRAMIATTIRKPAPDAAAKANALARSTGLPVATVDDNLQALSDQVNAARARALIQKSPDFARWVANPRNAAVAADDVDGLSKNGEKWGAVRFNPRDAISPLAPPSPTIGNILGGLGTAFSEGWQQVGNALPGLLSDLFGPIDLAAPGTPKLQDNVSRNTQRAYLQSQAQVDRTTPEFKSWYGRGLYGGASSLAQMLPSVALGVVTGQPEIGLGMAGAQQALPAYTKYRARGATVGQAALGGGAEGAIEVVTEKLPLGFVVGKLGKTGAGQFISGYLGRELPGELAATLGQNAVDTAIANPDKTWGQYLAEQPDQLVQTAIGTLVSGGFFAGLNRAAGVYAKRDAAARDAAQLALVDDAMTAAGESKTRLRDPQAFAEYIALHTNDTPAENLFIPAEKVATYFQSHDIDYRSDEFWAAHADQIDEALSSGGDVVLPTADVAAHLSGTPAWDALRNDVRLSPGGVSIAEAKALDESHGAELERLGKEAADQATAANEADAPRQAIYQDIRDKLTNAGYTQDAAHTNAELIAQRYATRAARLGQELKGDETAKITINQVLPDNLAPIVAASPGDVGLKSVINVMRGAAPKDTRLSLLDWIAQQGGIEDPGGDLAALGLAPIKGAARKGQRKLIRASGDTGQVSFLGADGRQNTNTPDFLALRAVEAGYFPAGERPTINDLFEAIDKELRGAPQYKVDEQDGPERMQRAADELGAILSEAGLDPATATDAEIKDAVAAYQVAQEGGLRQSYGDGPRGQISFAEGRTIIDLFQSRNTSTFLHESGHQWLEELRVDAESPDAPQQLRDDWQAVQDWLKANGHTVTDGIIPVDGHELFARGVERFLMEGKSPSSVLRRVFDAFRSWLLNVYQVVDNLRSPITPEIREVMQRLVATDDEIEAAREQERIGLLFDDAAKAGMTEAEYAAYKGLADQARDEAHDALLYKTMASIRAARTKAWKEEEAGVRDDITSRVNRRPEFKALHLLRTGRMLDDPEAEPVAAKLDRQWLIQTYGEGILAALPRGVPPIYSDRGTMPADEIAERVGFATGDDMVRTLVTLADRTKELRDAGDTRSVRQVLIDEETRTEMLDRHGDVLNDGSIEQEALVAVHSERQGEVMAAELRSLGRRANRQPTPYSLAKDWARSKIAGGLVRDTISGSAIQQYSRAAAKAGKAAEQALMTDDLDEAYRQKQIQMLNNALIAEAGKAREAVTAARDRLAGYAKRKTIKSMDQDYLDQIHGLLDQVEFRDRSQASIDRQQSFEEWAKAREADGFDVVVPSSFAESLGTTHWSRLSVEKMLGLDDTVKQIAHLGRLKQKLIDVKEQREFDAVRGEALGQIDQLPPRPPSDLMEPGFADRLKAGVQNIDASLLKMETIVDWLDGGKSDGVFNRVVFKPIADAQTREADMTADYFGRIRAHMEAVPVEDVRRWQDKISLPELINRETGNPFVMSRQSLIAVALNMGNEGNIQRLTDGYRWNREAVMRALNRELTAGEWQFVQNVWDTIDTLWPEVAAMERRVNGVEPEKVEATPIETPHGTLRGGYYPAIYDSARSVEAGAQQGKSTDLLEATYTRASTRASATKDRAAKVQRPILLQLGVINRHLGEVIHDITHREAIINADRFLSDPKIMRAVDGTLGPAVRQQFRPWLKHVANQWALERSGNEGIGKFINKARANATVVGMGFRISTIMTQLAGYSNSAEVVGAKWLGAAFAQTAQRPVETWKFVTERSGEVRNRMDTLDRDIGAAIRGLTGQRDIIADAKRFAFHGIGYTDRMVVVPTWIAAYNKAIASGEAEDAAIYQADKVVRQSQGAGSAKDLAAIQRGTGKWGELLKISTMFYSYMSAFYQRQRTLGRDVAGAVRDGNVAMTPGLLARAWWLIVVPPVLSELLAGRGPGDDEDWGLWAFEKMLFQMLGPIPIVRDAAQPVWNGLTGQKGFGYQLSPMQRAGDTIVNVAKDAGATLQGKPTQHAVRNTLDAVGYTTGIVPGQISTATQFLVDVGYGEQDPQTVAEWWRGLTTGKTEPKK